MGPLEFTVLGFEGDHVSAGVLRQLEHAHRHEIIRVIDILFVIKRESGKVEVREISDLPDEELVYLRPFIDTAAERRGWFALEDIDVVAEQLPASTSGMVVLLEHVWASRLRSAVIDAGGFVVVDGRVPAPLVDEVVDVMAVRGI